MPFVTIYKADQPSLAQMAGLGVVNPSVRLSCLPLWCVLRSLGQDQVISLAFSPEKGRYEVKMRNIQTAKRKLEDFRNHHHHSQVRARVRGVFTMLEEVTTNND